jgi:hypothetical protein
MTPPLLEGAAFQDAFKASWRASPALRMLVAALTFDPAVTLTRAHGTSMILTDNNDIEETS